MKPRHFLCALVSLLAALSARAEILERVVARVNGDIITLSEFEARQIAAVQAARVGPDNIERFLRENNSRILQEAIDELLLVQRAAELGMASGLSDSYIDTVVEGIKKDNKIESDQALVDQLRLEGMSVNDLKRSIRRSILRRHVLQTEIESRITVTELEARAEYEAHQEQFTSPEGVRLSELLVQGPDALSRATQLLERIRSGEDFATLAREQSSAPSATGGGDLGRIARRDLAADLEQQAYALAPGEVSEPLATAGGDYRLVKLVERYEASTTSFEAVRPKVIEALREQRLVGEYDRYMTQLREPAAIDVRVREVPLQVDLPDFEALAAKISGTIMGPSPAAEPASDSPTPAPIGADEAEFVTTPQDVPERVNSPSEDTADAPKPPDPGS